MNREVFTTGIPLMLLLLLPAVAAGQPPASVTGQTVDSRKGYIMRVPEAALLDSSASGWSPEGRFERRIYRIPGVGEYRLTVTVQPQRIPDSAVTVVPYTYVDADSATTAGSAYIRTYYLPTRSVRIEIIPYGVGMAPYIAARETTFKSFRWKPGAGNNSADTDPFVVPPNQVREPGTAAGNREK